MRIVAVAIWLIAVQGLAAAQDTPRSVKTEKIRQPSPEVTALYSVDNGGQVRIDWEAAETLAATKADRTLSPIAQVMLAIRDRNWKPMR